MILLSASLCWLKQAGKAQQDLVKGTLDHTSGCKSDMIAIQKNMWDGKNCGDLLRLYNLLQSVLWSQQCTFLPHAKLTHPSPNPNVSSQ